MKFFNSSSSASEAAPTAPRATRRDSAMSRGRSSYAGSIADEKDPRRSFSSDFNVSDAGNPAAEPKAASRHSWVKPGPTVNVYTTCGRHADQLLFGGHPSLTEIARSVFGKH